MPIKACLCLLLLLELLACAQVPDAYHVVWDSPSKDSLDSMPLSDRHGAGVNVWIQDGSIWLYLVHNDAYDEQGRLLKLACVRLSPRGSQLGNQGLRQELPARESAKADELKRWREFQVFSPS